MAGIISNVILGLGMGVLQLIVGLVLAIGSIYIGLSVFGKFTKGIDEEEELKKGNIAVGILLAAVILSIANVIQSSVSGMMGALSPGQGMREIIFALIGGIIQVIIGVVFAVISIYLAINVLDKITKNIDEMAELKKGNVAIAIVMAGVLIAVSFVVQAGVSGVARAIGVTI